MYFKDKFVVTKHKRRNPLLSYNLTL